MKWRNSPKPKQDPTEWHQVFLWKPTKVWNTKEDCSYTYWLCFMMRRKNHNYEWEYSEPCWYY